MPPGDCSPATTAAARGFHYVQNGFYLKQGKSPGKFGPPDNPFSFGELPMMPGGNIPRFSHNVIAINGSAMPDDWQGKLLGADPLHRHLVLSERSERGASFTTRDIAFPVKNSDVAFRPVYMVNAPDGSVLIADFYERYIAHGQHYQSQIDPTSGRIYRLSAKGKQRDTDTRLDKKTDAQLRQLLDHPNKWHRQTAVRLLGQRADATAHVALRKQIETEHGQAALHGLWALHQSDGLDAAYATELLAHPNPHVRAWVVRLQGDRRELSAGFEAVRQLARHGPPGSALANRRHRFPAAARSGDCRWRRSYCNAPMISMIRSSRCNAGGCWNAILRMIALRCSRCLTIRNFPPADGGTAYPRAPHAPARRPR